MTTTSSASAPTASPGCAAVRPLRGPGRPPRSERRACRWWLAWLRVDQGSVAAEVTIAAPFLIMLLVFVAVVIHRGVDARLRIEDAAHQAARAASIERIFATATTAAQSAARSALSSAGVSCASLTVNTATGGMRPGGTVSVTITCAVDFGDALILGVPGKTLSATAIEPIDTWRAASGEVTSLRAEGGVADEPLRASSVRRGSA